MGRRKMCCVLLACEHRTPREVKGKNGPCLGFILSSLRKPELPSTEVKWRRPKEFQRIPFIDECDLEIEHANETKPGM